MGANDLRGLREALETREYGRSHEHHDALDSTNDRAASWLREGGPHGLVVTADTQRAGRGRNGRAWCSPAGENLYVSLGLRIDQPTRPDFGAVSLAVGLGLFRGLGPLEGLGLKWPNDVLVRDRKLAGILCESRWSGGKVELVIGFGINMSPEGIDPDIASIATSLRSEGIAVSRVDVLAAVLASLESVLGDFFAHGLSAIRKAYLRANVQIGTRVRVRHSAQVLEGTASTIDDAGALIVRTDDGSPHVVRAADVETVRMTPSSRVERG